MLEVMISSGNHSIPRGLTLSLDQLGDGFMGWGIIIGDFYFAVAENLQRKIWDHVFPNPFSRFHRVLAPDGRAGRENFYESETRSGALQFERFAHRSSCLHDVLVVGER